MSTVVLENGAYHAKIGFIHDTLPKSVPNCVIKAKTVRNRIFIADEINDCKDFSGLYYLLAFQKGYLVNWEIERQVWDHMFGKKGISADMQESGLIITEPYLNFQSVQEAMDEILFEEYQVPFLLRCNSSYLSQYKYCKENLAKVGCLVIDSGYSFTHLAPYCNGKLMKKYLKRINVGGKLLTNHLKDLISYRQLMVMDETHVINQLKEDTCFVSLDFNKDMEIARKKGADNSIACDYILPDYTHIRRGHIKEANTLVENDQQLIRMCNESFSIPEILFHPSDIGIHEMGVAEAAVHLIQQLPEALRSHMYENIILTGGNCNIPNFKKRLLNEIATMAPSEYHISIHLSNSPELDSWYGGSLLGNSCDFPALIVSRDQYDEYGANICQDTFAHFTY